ncbi:MAG: hypothetical protein U5L73_15990 [Rhodoferax sp.]|uniref:hypothetical protein n=1 Tax=Rhodoferax sp. TaxID=50421 RepID=UPI002ACD34E4|nr:hypothetical protein [Rhodoferax sp.]MDZ7893240.1 hypothetical protein [Rhodoferax sp.]
MKAITIRLTEVQEKQIERFANSKRITFTEATRLAAISFLENEGKAQNEKAEHEATRERVDGLAKALTVVLKANAEAAANQDNYLKAIYSQLAPKKEVQK